MSKRLFVAVKIIPSNKLVSIYNNLQSKLKDDGIKWVYIDNLHLTLKFLGETDEQLIPEIFSVLNKVLNEFDGFKIAIKGIGKFSNRKKTKTIWLGVEDIDNQLSQISYLLNKGFSPLGFKPEIRTFKAHLTLARLKYIQNEPIFDDIIRTYTDNEFQQLIIDELILVCLAGKPFR